MRAVVFTKQEELPTFQPPNPSPLFRRFFYCLLPQLQRRRRCLKVDYFSSREGTIRVNVGERWKAAGNSAGTARRPRDFLRSSGFCSRRTRCNLKRDEEAKQTGEGRRLCPIPSSNLVSANPMLGQRKRQRNRDYYVVLAGIGVRRCCIPLPIAIP